MSGATRGETVALINYDSGNLHSAEKALARMAAPLGMEVVVTADPDVVATADRVVLPGVGAFGDCAAGLRAVNGMVEAIETRVRKDGRPFLGICVGAQLMAEAGLERGRHDGLGWLKGDVVALAPSDKSLKIPHMGWNQLTLLGPHPVIARAPSTRFAYFVHSFHIDPDNPAAVIATADYGGPVTAIVAVDTAVGVQFHPEKSQTFGLALIDGFLRWRP